MAINAKLIANACFLIQPPVFQFLDSDKKHSGEEAIGPSRELSVLAYWASRSLPPTVFTLFLPYSFGTSAKG